jgi:hypothetical protein
MDINESTRPSDKNSGGAKNSTKNRREKISDDKSSLRYSDDC